ncbi:Major sperm protein [Caenorhabditis elegans]|uniref:Major sperm protein n=1 Tax=Caenorhabditis elegans TaxID=6239 RepID=Q9U2V8_CAEEL|nr:Major sperm protein [Caenorhabditis elegans]CAB55166.2 Major sperm protein [Caenorhabditis elegans]|eukprot:NP_502995.1 Major sperm protein [Caenorhabditis elegans]
MNNFLSICLRLLLFDFHDLFSTKNNDSAFLVSLTKRNTIPEYQSVPPGAVITEPAKKIIFNAPFDSMHTYQVKVINLSNRTIAYNIRTLNMKRFSIYPPCGILKKTQNMFFNITFAPFNYTTENTKNDRITVKWINTPNNEDDEYFREWFHGDGMVNQHHIYIQYNI